MSKNTWSVNFLNLIEARMGYAAAAWVQMQPALSGDKEIDILVATNVAYYVQKSICPLEQPETVEFMTIEKAYSLAKGNNLAICLGVYYSRFETLDDAQACVEARRAWALEQALRLGELATKAEPLTRDTDDTIVVMDKIHPITRDTLAAAGYVAVANWQEEYVRLVREVDLEAELNA